MYCICKVCVLHMYTISNTIFTCASYVNLPTYIAHIVNHMYNICAAVLNMYKFDFFRSVYCINRVFDCYIYCILIFLVGYSQIGPKLGYARGTQLIFKILEVYLHDHTRQLEYSKQYSMIESYVLQVHFYFSSLFTEQTSKLLPKNDPRLSARRLLYPIRRINLKCTIGDHK